MTLDRLRQAARQSQTIENKAGERVATIALVANLASPANLANVAFGKAFSTKPELALADVQSPDSVLERGGRNIELRGRA
jgi:hypothetical protein